MSSYQSNVPKGQRKSFLSTVGSGILDYGSLLKVTLLHIPTDRFD